jgi:hypothetical protein
VGWNTLAQQHAASAETAAEPDETQVQQWLVDLADMYPSLFFFTLADRYSSPFFFI